ncbi:MAG: DUF6263 family protein [Pirellulaceae bacterium]
MVFRSLVPSVLSCWSLCTVLILAGQGPNRALADELRWKFATGDRYAVTYEQQVEQTTEVLLKPVTIETHSKIEMEWEVLGVDSDGNATIRQRFSGLELTIRSSRGDFLEFDSSVDDAETGKGSEVGKVLMPLMEAPYEITMSPRGEILKVEVPETSLEEIRQSASSMRLRRLFSEESLVETLSFVAVTLPEGEVSPGESWESERAAGTPELPLTVSHRFTYERGPVDSIEPIQLEEEGTPEARLVDSPDDAAAARVGIETTVAMGDPDAEREDGSRLAKLTQQTSRGSLWFDVEAGHPRRAVQIQELVTETPLREMTIEVRGKTSTVTTVVKQ